MIEFTKQLSRLRQFVSRIIPEVVKRQMKRMGQSGKAHFEVERKFAISDAEFKSLPATLRSRGFRPAGQAFMVDTFIPAAVEGDMIRLREETMNDKTHTVLTLKRWVQVAGNKEREETPDEVLSDVVRDCLIEVGTRLKGGDLSHFSKDRDHFESLTEDGRKVVVTLDTTHGLGQYDGHYMEIELLVPVGGDVVAARQYIQDLAKDLLGDEREFVKLSYMEMLKRTESVS